MQGNKKIAAALCCLLAIGTGLFANTALQETTEPDSPIGNPIIRNGYTADPAPMVVGDTLWLFTSHDDPDPARHLKDWRLFSTTDMRNWTEHPTPLRLSDFAWDRSGRAYAAQAIERDGKYYLYVSTDGSGIGVAVADRPQGP